MVKKPLSVLLTHSCLRIAPLCITLLMMSEIVQTCILLVSETTVVQHRLPKPFEHACVLTAGRRSAHLAPRVMLQSSVYVLRLSRSRMGAEHGVALWRLFSDAVTPGATNAEASQTPKAALRAHSQIQEVDVNYRSPTERVWPASPRQQKVGSRVLRALEMTLSEPKYMQTLVKQYGLCFEEVRMSPDMLVAYVLWSAHPEHEERTQQELHRQLSKIRMSLGRGLKARNVPRLEFRHNELSASQQAVEEEFERLAKLEEA